MGALALTILLLREPVNLARMFSAELIVAGIVGLKLSAYIDIGRKGVDRAIY